MQFRLIHLLAVVTGFCVLLGLVFVSPPAISVAILFLLLPCPPAIWATGIAFGRGNYKALFIGSLAAGAIYWLFAFYQSFNGTDGVANLYKYDSSDYFWQPAYQTGAWWSHMVLASPWIAGFVGGIAGLVTYRIVT